MESLVYIAVVLCVLSCMIIGFCNALDLVMRKRRDKLKEAEVREDIKAMYYAIMSGVHDGVYDEGVNDILDYYNLRVTNEGRIVDEY